MPTAGLGWILELEHEMQNLRGQWLRVSVRVGTRFGTFRLAGMYDAHVCAVAVGGVAILVEAGGLHRHAAHDCTCFRRDVPHIA